MKDQVIREHEDGSIIEIKVHPASSRRGLEGIRDNQVLLCVHSAPEKGRANKEALKVLAEALAIPPSRLEVLRGRSSRNKTVLARGLSPSEIRTRLSIS
jgi:uncharacterized protein (TIGR00251 family)